MTIKAWPDLRIGKGEVAENLKIFWGKVGEFIWGPRFWFSFFVTQQVTKRKHNSFRYVSGSKRYMCHYFAKYTVDISALQYYCFPQL